MNNDLNPSLVTGGSCEPAVCATCAVRNSSLCASLSSDELDELNKLSRRKSLRPGQIYVFEGDQVSDFANVVKGVAKLTRGSEDGRMQIVGLLFPSDFIGVSMGLGHGGERKPEEPYTIEAVSDLELCIFPRDGFERLMRRFPALEHKLLDRTLSELQVAREWMVLLGRKTAQERVATFILHVADKMRHQGCHSGISFDLPLGRGDIADHIGLTIETVSRQITQLKRKGIIDMQGARHVVSCDFEALREQSGY